MQPVDDQFARRLRVLTKFLIIKLHEQTIENEEQNRIFDLDAYRKDLAESNPETARWFEQTTADDREETLKQIAMVEAIAHGILWAMDHLGEDL
jgi:hypothetical protein